MVHVLALGRRRPTRATQRGTDPTYRIVCALGFVALVSIAHSPSFVVLAGAGFLVLLALQPAPRIASALRRSIPAAVFTALVLLPYAFTAGPARPLLLALKVFLCTGAVTLAAATTEWASLSVAARRLGVPSLVVMILDVTIRFIALLGELALEWLEAVRLRSVGRNARKGAALGGVAGSLFLRSRELAEDLDAAMTCRGFTGEYRAHGRRAHGRYDAVLGAGLAVLALVFLAWPRMP